MLPMTRYTNCRAMTLRPGEVILIRIGFHQGPGGKLRPAVVLLDSADDADKTALAEVLLRAFSLDR